MPAISARFTADVTDFRAKLATATTEVAGFQRTTSQVNNELRKFGNEFSGANVIRAAESMAKAVGELGGVTKLTEAEQKKLNAAVTEAIAKYDALGQQAPADLRALKEETDKAAQSAKGLGAGVKESEGSLLSFKGVAGTIGGVVAGAFTVGAITSFAKSVIDLGGEIEDLSARTGLSIEAVQELKYAADQTGSSIDAVGSSIDQMSNRLAEGSKGTRAAITELGLSFDDLRSKSPEDAFSALVDRIKEVPDPMQQTQLAMDLFGKSGVELLPAIRQGFADLRQEARDTAQVISEDGVKALAAFGDKWDSVLTTMKVSAATAVLDIGKTFSSLEGVLDSILAAGRMGLGPGGVGAAVAVVGAGRNVVDGRARTEDIALPPEVPKSHREAAVAIDAHATAIQSLADAWRKADLVKQVQMMGQAFGQLTPAQKANADITAKVVEEYGKLRTHVNTSALPRDLEAFYQAHLPVISGTRELIDVTGRYATSTLPDLSKRAQEARNMLAGLTAEGIIPTSRSFADLSTQMNVPTPVGLVNIGQQVTTNRELMSEWERDTRRALTNIRQDFSFTFAEMLTGQVGWKDGALGIWNSFKNGVTDILGSILDSFINSFLKGITNALLGESGGWSQIFAGAFGGGGGGGGASSVTGGVTNNLTNRAVNWGMGALGIGGGVATAVPGITATTSGFAAGVPSLGIGAAASGGTGAAGAGAGAGAGGTFGGLSVAGALGGAAAGGAGLGLGFLGQEIFGGAGWKAAGFGAGTGAATGALIGSVVPGIGTAVGAIVGGLAGLIGGWIGESVGEKVNNARDEFLLQKDDQGRAVFGGSGTGEGSAFNNLSTDLAKVQGGDKLFTNLIKADDFKELNAAVKEIVETLGGAEYNTIKVREGFDALTAQREALLALGADENAVLATQAGSYSLLFDTIKKTGAETPEALLPIFQSLIDMGLLVDENGAKVTNLADVAFTRLTATAAKFGTDTKAAFEEVSRQLDEFVEKGFLSAEQADEMRLKFKGMEEGAEAVDDTTASVEELSTKVLVSRDRAEELRKQLLEQTNAHTTIRGTTDEIEALTSAIREAEQQAADLQAALERANSVPTPQAPTSQSPGGSQGAWDGPSFASGGWGNFGNGTLAMLHGREAIIQLDKMGGGSSLDALARSRHSGQPIVIQHTTLLDGAVVARNQVRHIPGAMRQMGVA